MPARSRPIKFVRTDRQLVDQVLQPARKKLYYLGANFIIRAQQVIRLLKRYSTVTDFAKLRG